MYFLFSSFHNCVTLFPPSVVLRLNPNPKQQYFQWQPILVVSKVETIGGYRTAGTDHRPSSI